MKLLFDENLSPKLPRLLAAMFPGSTHVLECGLLGQSDGDVWEYARANAFTISSRFTSRTSTRLMRTRSSRLSSFRSTEAPNTNAK